MEKVLEDINKVAITFLAPHEPDDMYKVIVEEAQRLTDTEFGSIFLHEHDELKRVYTSNEMFYEVKPRKKGYIFQAFISRKPAVLRIDEVDGTHPSLKALGVKTIIVLPLQYKGDAIGVLTLQDTSSTSYSKQQLNVMQLFAALATMAVRKTQLYEEIKQALETRDLFISLASHELRTPLTSINGYIQLLHSKLSKKDTVEAKWVKELYDESIRLTNLVKELLEINRIKQGQLHYNLEEVDILKVLGDAIERHRFIHKEHAVAFAQPVTTKRLAVIGDAEKLLQMFTGILSNADKFSPSNKPIDVSVKYSKTQVTISVTDKGTGIPKEDLKRVMDGFYKSGDRQTEGLGVGLLLAKHILQYHHGSLVLKSKIKKGTTAEIRLPLLH